MSEWAGFSDETLKKFVKPVEKTHTGKGLKSVNSTKTGTRKTTVIQKNSQNKSSASTSEGLQEDQKLSKNTLKNDNRQNEMKNETASAKPFKEPSTGTGAQESPSSKKNEPLSSEPNEENSAAILDDSTFQEKEKITIDKFRDRQKEIEEMNKKKRAMLTSAISEKAKRTKEEAAKLMQIRKELEALDQMVSSDVSIVRDRIEVVTRNYGLSQRRYEMAEKEFIAAKIELHEQSELKQQLTEHLYTIIHQNELRKAQKLDQLTNQLDSTALQDFMPIENESPIIPSILTSTIAQPDIQKFRHKLQAGLEGLAEGNTEQAKGSQRQLVEGIKEVSEEVKPSPSTSKKNEVSSEEPNDNPVKE